MPTTSVSPAAAPATGAGVTPGVNFKGSLYKNSTTKVYVSFDATSVFVPNTWTDISRYVMSFKTTMGRQHELQQVNPSTAQITLVNEGIPGSTGGRFSPWNTNSPYYNSGTGLTPGRPVKITETWGGTTYPVFYGYVDNWTPAYSGTRSTMNLNASDGLKLLNLNTLDVNGYGLYPTANAMNYWPLTDPIGSATAADAVGGNNLSVTGRVTFGHASAFLTSTGTSATLAATGELGVSSTITLSGAAYTFECWVKTTNGFFELMTSGAGGGLASNISGTGYVVWNLGYSVTSTVAINDGNWHHIVGTLDGTTANLYIDGALNNSVSSPGSVSDTFLGIGEHVGTGGPQTSASLAQCAIYASTMSGAVVASQYAIGSAGFVVQDSGSRINAILNLAEVPVGMNNVGTANVIVEAATSSLATTTAMSYINTVAKTERGFFFQDAAGVFQYYSRHYPYENAMSATSQATFGYATNQLHYYSDGIVPQSDDLDLWNNIPVSSNGGVTQTAIDATSQGLYGRRTLTGYTGLLFTNDGDSYDLATGLLYQYKNPAPRVRAISMDSTINNGENMVQMLGLGLLDRITINWKPLDGSSVDFSQQSLIEQIGHSFDAATGVWTTTFAVTPIGTESFFIIGTSQLGTGILGF